jgi:hypothetical protein
MKIFPDFAEVLEAGALLTTFHPVSFGVLAESLFKDFNLCQFVRPPLANRPIVPI